jgi:hypothetical protein
MAAIYGAVIQNEAAYNAAIKLNIIANARKTFQRTYADHEAVLDFIDAGREYNGYGRVTYKEGFVGSLANAYDRFGKLTEGQVNAVRKCITQREERKAEWADKQAALNANRQHLGTVGEKITLTLTIKKVIGLESVYGVTLLTILEDADNNVVIYKGNAGAVTINPNGSFYNEGDTITITATVKEHGVRNGVKQTVIQRPKAA